jgi:hypothetical protein
MTADLGAVGVVVAVLVAAAKLTRFERAAATSPRGDHPIHHHVAGDDSEHRGKCGCSRSDLAKRQEGTTVDMT